MHLPFSPGTTSDDRLLRDTSHFHGMTVVVTEKLDGENTTMNPDRLHARSVDGRDHPSRSYVKGIHGAIVEDIPTNWRICGENMFAKHSIFYTNLDAYFYVFSIWTDQNRCLSWKETEIFAEMLGLRVVPVLYYGPWDEKAIQACWTGVSRFGPQQEGYVVRNVESFHYDAFEHNVAKFVSDTFSRSLKDSTHWSTQAVTPNLLSLRDK
jgi:ATP-dependent RNA circularization protein (DNA/RNA ligase family)